VPEVPAAAGGKEDAQRATKTAGSSGHTALDQSYTQFNYVSRNIQASQISRTWMAIYRAPLHRSPAGHQAGPRRRPAAGACPGAARDQRRPRLRRHQQSRQRLRPAGRRPPRRCAGQPARARTGNLPLVHPRYRSDAEHRRCRATAGPLHWSGLPAGYRTAFFADRRVILLIIAGAGSGRTSAPAHRVAQGIDPDRILLLTLPGSGDRCIGQTAGLDSTKHVCALWKQAARTSGGLTGHSLRRRCATPRHSPSGAAHR